MPVEITICVSNDARPTADAAAARRSYVIRTANHVAAAAVICIKLDSSLTPVRLPVEITICVSNDARPTADAAAARRSYVIRTANHVASAAVICVELDGSLTPVRLLVEGAGGISDNTRPIADAVGARVRKNVRLIAIEATPTTV